MTRTAHSLSTPVEATAAERLVVRRTCLTERGGFDRFEMNFTENVGVADEGPREEKTIDIYYGMSLERRELQ